MSSVSSWAHTGLPDAQTLFGKILKKAEQGGGTGMDEKRFTLLQAA